ncbi:hypothetical protein N9N67_10840 [Bacteriovoracaceae bacterium]|nr:hypothetical protein [Bacteriovoracaceae bacterium]
MKLSSLTENEVKEISEILDRCSIRYSVNIDQDTKESNKLSLKNDLRHYNMASLSDGVLCIDVNEDDLLKIDFKGIKELEKLNIFLNSEEPDFHAEELESKDRSPSKLIVEENRDLVGKSKLLELQVLFYILLGIGILSLILYMTGFKINS